MKKKGFTIDVRPVRSEVLSPQAFLKMRKAEPRLIERAEFIAPSPGKPGFGMFQVHYKSPIYKRVVHG